MHFTKDNTSPLADCLRPDFADESTARLAGWHPITSALYMPQELDVALSIHATLAGTAPASRPARFCIIGDRRRFVFARHVDDVVGFDTEPEATTPPAPRVEPVADAA